MAKNLRTNIYEGGLTVDPSAGAGVAAPVGSVIVRMTTPEVWQKFGVGDTDWRRIDLIDGNKGDITVSGNGATWTINNAAVTLAKMANLPAASVIGSVAGGVPAALTGTQVTSLLDVFTSVLKGLVPASGGGTTNFLRADASFAAPTTTGLGGSSGFYGTGIDGVVTIPAGTATLTRDMEYSTLVVQAGGILITDLWCIRASISITVDATGVIHQDGNTTVTTTGGPAGGSASRTYGRGGNGGNAGVGAGGAGGNVIDQPKPLPLTGPTSSIGGPGGAGSAGAGGAAGTVTNTTQVGSYLALPDVIRGCYAQAQASRPVGGSGGGAGGGNGVTGGIGGGGGGGIVVVAAPTITNNGTIRANGGAGGNAINANCGGGGGGGGGKAFPICRIYVGTAPEVNGGAPGAPTGTGVAGTIGQTGYTFTFVGV